MEEKIDLSIIILSYNTRELLKKCLDSVISDLQLAVREKGRGFDTPPITNHQPPITEIIVVDNGSTDGSVEEIKNEKLKIKNKDLRLIVIENKENVGFARGNNQGIKEAKGEYIMLLNSDTVVKKGSITKLIEYLDTHQEIAVVGPRLLNEDGSAQASCGRSPNMKVVALMLFKEHFGGSRFVRWSPEESTGVDWLMGAAFMARKEVFQKIGGLDEKLFMYMEEVEWFYRAKQAGFKAYFLKEAEIVHLGRGSSVSGKKEPILNIYKGILYFYRKHKSPIELFILRTMLKLKALLALILGWLKNDKYLKETYGQAIKIS